MPIIDEDLSSAESNTRPSSSEVTWPQPPNPSLGRYKKAAVATSQPECAQIGNRMMIEGGSAVDAAIAVSLCLGVYRTLSSGIGGGSFMTYYER